MNIFRRCSTRLMSTASTASPAPTSYPFSKTAIILPPRQTSPPERLKDGVGLMPYLLKSLPTTEKQAMLDRLFSRRSKEQLRPGSIIAVDMEHAPGQFTGVLLAIRRRGPETSFVLRNVLQRVGVEMQFFVNSPLVKSIKVLQVPPKGRMKRAKLFYLRDSPEKMTQIATQKRTKAKK